MFGVSCLETVRHVLSQLFVSAQPHRQYSAVRKLLQFYLERKANFIDGEIADKVSTKTQVDANNYELPGRCELR